MSREDRTIHEKNLKFKINNIRFAVQNCKNTSLAFKWKQLEKRVHEANRLAYVDLIDLCTPNHDDVASASSIIKNESSPITSASLESSLEDLFNSGKYKKLIKEFVGFSNKAKDTGELIEFNKNVLNLVAKAVLKSVNPLYKINKNKKIFFFHVSFPKFVL